DVVRSFIGTQYYDQHIDKTLVEEIQRIQGNLPLTSEQIPNLIEVLKLSPTALSVCLHPIQMIVQHRTGENAVTGELIDPEDVKYLFNTAYECLFSDFRNPA